MRLSKYDRLLYILNLIRSRKNLNADLLADECEVTPRTIYRDIVSISSANIPIYYDKGYKYASGNFLPPLNFDIDEYLTLKMILESSPLRASSKYRQTLKSIASKVDSVISPLVKSQKLTTPDTTKISIKSTMADNVSGEIYAIIEKAIRNCLQIEMGYNSIETGITTRRVDPYFMIFIEKAFYFVGWCHERKELRTFRIDRIDNVKLTDVGFIPRKDINPQKYFENSWGIFSGEPIEVEAIFSGAAARVISLGKHHASEKIKMLKNGRLKYKVIVAGDKEIFKWLLGFGSEVTVIKPPALAQKIRQTAEDILKSYKK